MTTSPSKPRPSAAASGTQAKQPAKDPAKGNPPKDPNKTPDNGQKKKGRPPGSETVQVNFKALSVADDDAPTRAGTSAQDNPTAVWVKASWDERKPGNTTGKGKSVTLPSEAEANRVANLVRYAADKLTDADGNKLGATVKVEKVAPNGWKVRFAAKKRKAAPKPKPKDETATPKTEESAS